MAYISTKQVSEIRNDIKSLFKSSQGWRFSISRRHYSTVVINILSAPIELRDDPEKWYDYVNCFYIENRSNKIGANLLQLINDVANKNNWDKSDIQTDYFNVGFYFSLSIGSREKPFIISNK